MPSTVDAFIEVVEAARRELIRREGQNVSVREVLRRAGYDEAQRASISYHLNSNRHTGSKAHHVPADVVRRLAKVLPVSEDELARAARVAAGFDVVDESSPDVAYVVQRYFGDETVSDEEKREVTVALMKILADEMERRRPSDDDRSPGGSGPLEVR